MSTLLNVGIKNEKGEWKNYTISIEDETNQWGKNVSIWEAQTQEEREAKKDRNFCGNGKVVWTNGTVKVAEKKPQDLPADMQEENDLPF